MNLFLGTVLLLLLLPDVAEGQDSCSDLHRGDQHGECCNVVLEQQNPGSSTRVLLLSQHCPELWRSKSPCLRERWLRLLQSEWHSWLAAPRLCSSMSAGLSPVMSSSPSPPQRAPAG